MQMQHHQVLIIGGGTAGITVASTLLRKNSKLDVTIIDPADKHYYQPAWTLVGAGAYKMKDTERPMRELIPSRAKWLQEFAAEIDPDHQTVTTSSGVHSYDYLVVCPGLQMWWDGVEGLKEAINHDNVCSNYVNPEYTWECIQKFKGGNALFVQPNTPIKCGGAPQKIMYLADDYFARAGVKNKTKMIFALPGNVIFSVKEFADTLMQVVQRKGIIVKFSYAMTKIDMGRKKAYFKLLAANGNGSPCLTINDADKKINEEIIGEAQIAIPYDMLHLAPPQAAPDFIQKSKLAHQDGPNKGWVNVNQNTLQHAVYQNVFALGDVAALPTSKTGAAVRKQAPIVVDNLLELIRTKRLNTKNYDGYTSCPLVTGYGKMVLAEFKYGNVRDSTPLISTFVDTTKEKYSMWLLKKYFLPWMYWNRTLKGKP